MITLSNVTLSNTIMFCTLLPFSRQAGIKQILKNHRTEQNKYFNTLKLLQFIVTLHTYTTIYNFGDKTGHNNNG
mgnify:CR=1 FL=1